jgi:two-component system sensor histidine kinase SenX3
VVTAALVVGLAGALCWAVALLVAQRTAAARVHAAAADLAAARVAHGGPGPGPDDPAPAADRPAGTVAVPGSTPASARDRSPGRRPGLDHDDEPVGGLDAALDRLEEAVAEAVASRRHGARSEDRLSWALGAIGHGVVLYDERGRVTYRNDPAASFLAARHSDVLVEEAISALARDALRGRVTSRELELFGPPRRILSLRAMPLEDPSRPSGALVVIEDTSERRHLENVRRDFVANVSHELKTPIGALALLAETLLDEPDPEVVRRLATRLATEAFRVGRTIDDLLELSRLEASSGGLRDDVVEVAVVTAEAAERARTAAEQHGIVIEDGDVPPGLTVVGERRQLVSAVTNLVDNAVKYSEPGSTVTLLARTDGAWVDVVVRDRGIGIPRRDLERIFERFYRVDRARSRETGGTGLGLAIVRHVASNHRGEVRVESREGVGSTFTLRLPAGPPRPPEAAHARSSPATLEGP